MPCYVRYLPSILLDLTWPYNLFLFDALPGNFEDERYDNLLQWEEEGFRKRWPGAKGTLRLIGD